MLKANCDKCNRANEGPGSDIDTLTSKGKNLKCSTCEVDPRIYKFGNHNSLIYRVFLPNYTLETLN